MLVTLYTYYNIIVYVPFKSTYYCMHEIHYNSDPLTRATSLPALILTILTPVKHDGCTSYGMAGTLLLSLNTIVHYTALLACYYNLVDIARHSI